MPLRRSLLAAVTLLAIGAPGFSRCVSDKELSAALDFTQWGTVCAIHKSGMLSYIDASKSLEIFMKGDDYDYLEETGLMAIELMLKKDRECMELINSFRWFRMPTRSDI